MVINYIHFLDFDYKSEKLYVGQLKIVDKKMLDHKLQMVQRIK